jgi:hypothetical protein
MMFSLTGSVERGDARVIMAMHRNPRTGVTAAHGARARGLSVESHAVRQKNPQRGAASGRITGARR